MLDCPQEFCVPALFVGLAPNSVVQKKIQRASQVVLVVKNPSANAGESRDLSSIPELGRSPGGKKMAPHSSILAYQSHGQRNLAGYSPWGCKDSHTTEHIKNDSRWEGGIGSVVC